MEKKRFALVAVVICSLAVFTLTAQAATITGCTFDEDVYQQGDTGVISVTVYNDKSDTIRVTELTAAMDYFYSDGTVYLQTWFTNATLPVEISVGQSSTLYVPFSLPTNVASGYIELFVRARTEIYSAQSHQWMASDTGISEPVLFIESPYKGQFEEEQLLNQQLQEQLEEQQEVNDQLQQQLDQQENAIAQLNQQLEELQASLNTNTIMMVALGIIAFSLVAVIMFLIAVNRKSRAIPQHVG